MNKNKEVEEVGDKKSQQRALKDHSSVPDWDQQLSQREFIATLGRVSQTVDDMEEMLRFEWRDYRRELASLGNVSLWADHPRASVSFIRPFLIEIGQVTTEADALPPPDEEWPDISYVYERLCPAIDGLAFFVEIISEDPLFPPGISQALEAAFNHLQNQTMWFLLCAELPDELIEKDLV